MQNNIIIFVSKLDNTSLMVLSLLLKNVFQQMGYQVSIVEWRRLNISSLFSCIQRIKSKNKQNIIISVGALADIFSSCLGLFLSGRNRKYISWLHCHPWDDLRWNFPLLVALPYFFFWILGLLRKEQIVCVSRDVAKSLPFFLRRRAVTIYNPVPCFSGFDELVRDADDSSYHEATDWILNQKQNGRIILLSYGLLRKRKNFSQAVRALSLDDSLSLILFGDGPQRDHLASLAMNLAVFDRLLILPFTSNPYRFCMHADIYVSNTHSEGFGLANVEAALTGIPVVLPKLDVNLEIFGSMKNVEYFDKDFDVSFIEAIRRGTSKGRSESYPANPYTHELFQLSWHKIVVNCFP